MFYQIILALAALVSAASAAYKVDGSAFQNGGLTAAQISQPLFFFAAGSCYPQDGEVDGQQTNGNPTTLCTINALSKGCLHQIPWSGQFNTKGNQVATYFSMDYCSGDNSWRVTYNLYFRHDASHESDWEWVSVIWKQDSHDGTWFTEGIMMEQDGQNAYYSWGNLNTFWDNGDMLSGTIGRGANHPKIYVDKWHHAMFPDPYGGNKDNCATAGRFRFRMNDWYMFDLENGNLASIDRISPSWGYGKATNPHATSAGICTKKTTKGEFGFFMELTKGGAQETIADSHEYL